MAYGESQYGASLFGIEPETKEPIQPYIPDLMRYLPPYYHGSRIMGSLLEAMAEELGVLWYAIDDILKQFFVATATWGLDLWEAELGLLTDRSKSYDRRREIVIAKLRGAGTTTRQMIINTAAAFSGGEVDVVEYPAEYRFVVQFVGVLGIPPNMAGLIQAIEDIKPAHLAYSFKYTYTTWNMLSGLTWGQAGQKTWGQLRTYEGE